MNPVLQVKNRVFQHDTEKFLADALLSVIADLYALDEMTPYNVKTDVNPEGYVRNYLMAKFGADHPAFVYIEKMLNREPQ